MVVVTYARLSVATDDTKNDHDAPNEMSIKVQQDAMRKYCAGFDHMVIGEYTDIWSGKTADDRKGLQAALQMVTDGKADGLVVYKIDRLGRSARDLLNIEHLFNRPGKGLHITEMRLDTSTGFGKLFFTMTAAFAEFERSQIADRTKAGLQRRKADGKKYCRRLVSRQTPQDTEVIETIKKYREVYGRSYQEIADHLNMLDIPAPEATRNGQKCIWHKSSVSRIYKREAEQHEQV